MKGYIHIYCGDGKGKTSAAIGLAVRAAGRNKKVLIARFLKTDDSGEVTALTDVPNILVMPCVKTFGFYYKMSDAQKAEAEKYYQSLLEESWKKAWEEGFDVLVLDEIMAVCQYGLVCEEWLLEQLKKKPEQLEVALTGRNPTEKMMELADYISEIRKVKHPFDRGVEARMGIEY